MKGLKITTLLLALVTLVSCQSVKKKIGGTIHVKLEKGQELMECTWKEDGNLWVLTRPMDSTYVPQKKVFQEYSNFGLIESKVIFTERR